MKRSSLAVLAAALAALGASSAAADTSVRGYTKKDGTYVQPHRRSDPDRSRYNNYSTKGNVNPYTGKKGTKSPTATSTSSRAGFGKSGYSYRSSGS